MQSNASFIPERINVASSVPKPGSKFVGLENRSTLNCRLKNGGLKRQEKNNPSHPPASEMYHTYIIEFLVYLINCTSLFLSSPFFITPDTRTVPESAQVPILQSSPD